MGMLDDLLAVWLGGRNESLPRRNRPRQNRRDERIENEILMIAPRFSENGGEGVNYDVKNFDWLIIPKYPLPARWEERWCKLLILFPETYPATAPVGFYLNKNFQLKDGGEDAHFTGRAYHGAADLLAQGWFWYCVQIPDGAWQPSADYRKPDNLFSYLTLVRESLTNDF